MQELDTETIERMRAAAAAAIHAHWKLFLIQGVVMMALGVFAVALPHIATLAVEIFVGWLFFAGGLIRALAVLWVRHVPGFWWSLGTSVLVLLLGLLLIVQPAQGVLTLTALIVLVFVVEGVASILIALDVRRHLRNWGWTLTGGIAQLVLAFLVWRGWPATANWAIGLLVGVNMLVLGISLAMMALAARGMRPD
jgi:uncharacterized membrane protein HdeD (DUF308 family)